MMAYIVATKHAVAPTTFFAIGTLEHQGEKIQPTINKMKFLQRQLLSYCNPVLYSPKGFILNHDFYEHATTMDVNLINIYLTCVKKLKELKKQFDNLLRKLFLHTIT